MSEQIASPERTDELSTGQLVALLGVVALFVLAFAAIAHHGCTTYPADIPRPEPGSARANYCAVADAGFPIVQLAVPLLVVLGAALLTRRNPRIVGCVVLVLIGIAIADMVLATKLDAWGFDHSARGWLAFPGV